MTKHPDVELSAYATGALAESDRANVDRHVAVCDECRATLADYRALVDQLATTAPDVPEIAWPRYRAELRVQVVAGKRVTWWARWLRPVPVTATSLAAVATAIVLFVASSSRPPADLAAMEYDGLAARMEMIDHYRVVEHLDLLEDLEVIRNLDRLTSTREG